MSVRRYHKSINLVQFFQPITGQQTSRNFKAVMSLVERRVGGQHFFVPSYVGATVYRFKDQIIEYNALVSSFKFFGGNHVQ